MLRVNYEESTHTYSIDDVVVPSVTQILSPLSRGYKGINPSVLEYAARRGTAIHEATENFDTGGLIDFDGETLPYITAYLDFNRDYRPNWFGVEDIVASPLGYAGTIDRWGEVCGENWVLDIKTINSPSRADYVKVCCQTFAYMGALQEDNDLDFKRKALFLKKDGSYRIVDCDEWEQKNGLDVSEVFFKLLDMNQMIDSVLSTKRGK